MSARPRTAALVLAAGLSERFGGDKLLAPLAGRPLGAWAMGEVSRALRGGLLASATVLHRRADACVESLALDAGLECLGVPGDAPALSRTLVLGIERALAGPPDLEGILIVLADQPMLRRAVILALLERAAPIEHATEAAAVRPCYTTEPSTPGHPVWISLALARRVRECEGDRGFSDLLRDEAVLRITVTVSGANPDVDTAADLARVGAALSHTA